MSGDRPTQPESPTQVQHSTSGAGGVPSPDGTLVVVHSADVKSVSGLKVEFVPVTGESHLSLIGQRVGPYKIQAELGAGGMGAVYLAEQLEPVHRQVALKVIKAGMDSEEVLARFHSERELLARMNHPNIAQVLDAGATAEGRLYFAMEYVPGVPLNEFCDRRGLDVRHRLELFVQVCEGVQHAHQKGVIHRDLKPSNLMVADYQGQLLVKVIDFGIAKSMDLRAVGSGGNTQFGLPIGTPAYMSPEQAAGDLAAIDTRTDVWSLGVVLYQLLTHVLPIANTVISQGLAGGLAQALREAEIRPPSRKVLDIAADGGSALNELKRALASDAQTLSRRLKGDLDWITLKALERERDQRYASVSEFVADVRRHLQQEAVLAGPPSKLYRARKFVARNKLAVGAAVALSVSLVGGIVGTSWMAIEAREQRALATAQSARAVAAQHFLEEMIAAPDPWKLSGATAETRNVRVVDALQAAAANLEHNLADNPALRGEIAVLLGRTLRRLGQLDASRAQLELAVRDLTASGAAQEMHRVEAELELGATLTDLGEFDAADPMFTALLPRIDSLPGLSVDTVAEARRSAATAATGVGDGARAEALARATLARVNAESPSNATAISGARAALADILGEQGNWDEADKLLNEAYIGERLRLGAGHPVVIELLSMSATLAYRKGDYELAEQRYREAALLADQILGFRHPRTLLFRSQATLALNDRGQHDRAVSEFREQMPAIVAVYGADHPEVLTARANFAIALRDAGELDAAEAEFEDVFRRRRAVLGETHPETLSAINHLGVIARQRKDSAKAEVLFRQASELYLKAKGPMHPESVMMQANYLAAVRDLGRIDEAVTGFAELLVRADQVFPADHWFVAVIRSHLGLAYMEARRYAEAEPMLLRSHALMLEQFGEDDARTQEFRRRIAVLYERWDRPDEAARHR